MYKYVEDKQFLSRMRSLCGEIMQDLCHTLKEEYDIGASFYLVGSGARNLILQNANQPIDLDYNLEITRIDDWEDCKEIKECDIQSKVHEVDSIVDLSMSPNEKDKIMGSEEPDLLFARYWSIKEAYMKCLGCGLNDKLSELDFSLFQNSHFIYDNLIFNTKYSRNVWITVCSAIDIRKIVIADIRDYIYSQDWTSLI